jgi:hypothetical protein
MTVLECDNAEPTENVGRLSIPKRLRFEVFKRDSFTCQYCGRRAPEVVLHCDHVNPVAQGGATDILNLVSSCLDCNLGKGARTLSDNAVLTRQLNQLASLQEKREQMEMMLAWRRELDQLDEIPPLELEKRWDELTGYTFTEMGKKKLKKLLSRFGFDEVAAAMKVAIDQYVERGDDGVSIKESVETAFNYIGGIANVQRAERREPGTKRMFYIRGILRNRVSYCPDWKAMALIKVSAQAGVPLDVIEQAAREASSWSRFKDDLEGYINQMYAREGQYERHRARIFAELTKFFEPEDAQAALEKVSAATSIGISLDYLLGMASGSMGSLTWEKYRVWLDYLQERWGRLICPLQDIFMVAFPPEKAGDVICLVEDLHYAPESILSAARQLGTWQRFEVWLDDTFSEAVEEDMRTNGMDPNAIAT